MLITTSFEDGLVQINPKGALTVVNPQIIVPENFVLADKETLLGNFARLLNSDRRIKYGLFPFGTPRVSVKAMAWIRNASGPDKSSFSPMNLGMLQLNTSEVDRFGVNLHFSVEPVRQMGLHCPTAKDLVEHVGNHLKAMLGLTDVS